MAGFRGRGLRVKVRLDHHAQAPPNDAVAVAPAQARLHAADSLCEREGMGNVSITSVRNRRREEGAPYGTRCSRRTSKWIS